MKKSQNIRQIAVEAKEIFQFKLKRSEKVCQTIRRVDIIRNHTPKAEFILEKNQKPMANRERIYEGWTQMQLPNASVDLNT